MEINPFLARQGQVRTIVSALPPPLCLIDVEFCPQSVMDAERQHRAAVLTTMSLTPVTLLGCLLSSDPCMLQASVEPFSSPEDFDILTTSEASDELDEPWLASMVAELLAPEGDAPGGVSGPQGAALPTSDPLSEYESMSGYESLLLQPPSQSKKRKHCFSAAD